MQRFAMISVIAALFSLLNFSPSAAQHLTVGAPSGLSIQPCVHDLSDVDEGVTAGWIWNRYSFSSIMDDNLDNTQDVLVTDLDEAFNARVPHLYFNSHGGVVVQTYPPSSQAVRNAHYNSLVPSLYPDWQVEPGTHWEDPQQTIVRFYTINCNEAFARNHYRGSKPGGVKRSVVHFAGCDAWDFRSEIRSPASGDGAAIFLSYDYLVFNNVVQDEGNTLYHRMSGGEGVTKRPMHQAVQGLTIRIDPATPSPPTAPDFVISPRVKATSLAQGAHFASAQTYWIDFDAPMKTTQPMSSVIGCEGKIKFDAGSLVWLNNGTRLQGTLRGLSPGSGEVVIDSYDPDNFDLDGMMSDTGIGLDGNTDPSNNTLGGELPAGDKWRGTYISDYADNPAARVSGFMVTRDGGSVSARWIVESEDSTDHYVVEHAPDPTQPFVPVTNVAAEGASVYETIVAGPSEGIYRLREVETDGDSLTQRYASVEEYRPFEPDVIDEVAAELLLQQLQQLYPAQPDALMTVTYTDVIFTPAVYQTQANTLASYKTSRGIPTLVVTLESIGGAINIKSTIASYVATGARNILLLGDANHDRDSQGFLIWNNASVWVNGYSHPAGTTAQPGLNFIPVGKYTLIPGPQATSMPYWEMDVANDWWYIDLDGDDLPDPGLSIGRLPASTAAEATNAVNKQIAAYQINPASAGVNHAFVFTYAFDVTGVSGTEAIAYTDSLMRYLPATLVKDRFVDKPSAWYTDAQRDQININAFNSGASLHIYKSTVNNRYHNAGGLDQNRAANLGTIVSNQYRLPFLYVSSCGGADVDRNELDAVGRPLNERLLENRSDLGCWGYFGPSRGSWQYGNYVMDKEFLTRLYTIGAPSAGQAAARAVYMVGMHHPELRDQAISYMFIGDPSVPLPHMQISTVGVEELTVSQTLRLGVPRPNPSRGSTMLHFTLPQAEQVTFDIVDVSGRLVARILDGHVEAGPHNVHWDGTNRAGARVPVGTYFAHLRVGSESRTQKMVVLR